VKSFSSTRSRFAAFLWFALAASMALTPGNSLAHPMGNFSISHYAGIRVEKSWIEIRYILDMAEIPTFQEMQQAGIAADPGNPGVSAYLSHKVEALKSGLIVSVNGRPLALEALSENVIFPPGAGGLPTMKIGMLYRASLTGTAHLGELCALTYRDDNYPERAGWKEVVAAAAPGLTLQSSTAATVSRSQELSNYPTDFINSPPQDLSAQLTFTLPASSGVGLASSGPSATPLQLSSMSTSVNTDSKTTRASGNPALAPESVSPGQRTIAAARAGTAKSSEGLRKGSVTQKPVVVTHASATGVAPPPMSSQPVALQANKQGTPSNRFTQLIATNQWGLWFLFTAALIAAALGGLHALEPGHGKTIVAAYLVGSQGTGAHALLLGLIVTATHTAGVYALGVITLYASKYIVPDHLYPWLGMASGLTIAALGAYMLRRRFLGYSHGHDHHHHHGMELAHDPGHADHQDHVHTHADHTHGPVHHKHAHHEHAHSHGPDHAYEHDHTHVHTQAHGHDHHEHSHNGSFSYRQLALLGVTGGIIPCPAALVVLLSAVSLHRVAFGLYLILAFSAGLAAVLISIGLITVYARRLLARVPSDGPVINRWLPMASAAVITCLGLAITLQGLSAMGVLRVRL
jgi:ABC-type nickel/cobalt efflux system permease component RcnA